MDRLFFFPPEPEKEVKMTQLEAALSGKITPELSDVSRQENIPSEKLLALVASGEVTIPANKLRGKRKLCGIGRALTVKVNANIGVSTSANSIEIEKGKLRAALDAGADAVMDLSVGPEALEMRGIFMKECDALTGCVPLYRLMTKFRGDVSVISEKDFIEAVLADARDGMDFATVHSGISLRELEHADKRVMGIVSRGGSFAARWMKYHKKENPLLTHYQEILDICREYDMTISLGDSLRPGALADAADSAQMGELARLGEQVLSARKKGVQAIVEGPGHVPLNLIEDQVKTADRLCHGAPLYLLGPLVTDMAPGYDHITGAIGGALAAYHGASFLCYVTPSEHLRLPNAEDVHEGVIASKIAGHAADVAKGRKASVDANLEFSKARKSFDWEKQFEMAIDPVKPRKLRAIDAACKTDECSMCGDFCAMKENR